LGLLVEKAIYGGIKVASFLMTPFLQNRSDIVIMAVTRQSHASGCFRDVPMKKRPSSGL
jgi:hypothetical protein